MFTTLSAIKSPCKLNASQKGKKTVISLSEKSEWIGMHFFYFSYLNNKFRLLEGHGLLVKTFVAPLLAHSIAPTTLRFDSTAVQSSALD